MFTQYPDVVDVTTMAEMLKISRKAAYELLSQNKIAYRKIGRIYRISKQAIIKFMTN